MSEPYASRWPLENRYMEEAEKHIEIHGISGIETYFNYLLNGWRDVEINIAVTGSSGVGKSSFINAMRNLSDDDYGAAPTGVIETTRKPTMYPYPTNNKIIFWDLPGIDTPNYPDLETNCKKIGLEKFDTFFIMTASRFTENDQLLARKVASINKSFFFIRTHLDQDYCNERRKKAFNEEDMVKQITEHCLRNLEMSRPGDVFLISNHHPNKWDFPRLIQAILDVFPCRQMESLTLSLNLLTSRSKNILKRKIEALRGRIWMVATASAAGAGLPIPGLSIAVDLTLLKRELDLYKLHLSLPEESSFEFQVMSTESQEVIRKFCFTSATEIGKLLVIYTGRSTVEEFARYIPFVGSVLAGTISFSSTYHFLQECLNELERAALSYLDGINARAADDLHID